MRVYVNLIITPKEIAIVNTRKIMIKDSKHAITKSHQIVKEDSKEEAGNKGAVRKQCAK